MVLDVFLYLEGYFSDVQDIFGEELKKALKDQNSKYEKKITDLILSIREGWMLYDDFDPDGYGHGSIKVNSLTEFFWFFSLLREKLKITLRGYGKINNFKIDIDIAKKCYFSLDIDGAAIENKVVNAANKSIELLSKALVGED